ncbi:alpha/beta hydrolase [Aestuariirhabdus sp. Z084]|uniref:alpha/beta fold hydrolase n=1 Tax=Aestuariirhabdus haliotis TaxID=2918751 RepID=UPI00201B4543|nr:alpha/beta hydrolase [Aestuariirhabdus haliotis]MCL6415018.1 alpha/beta hydrolase [Aestuariirhabdus haliotis]MCL6418950.1 alpha/beta hydrolase [Aestuariirhabdus haliotis]
MNAIRYGHPEGTKVIYFHGVPGGPQEAVMFESLARQHRLDVICPNRFSVSPALKGAAYFQRLAQDIDEAVEGAKVVLIGFSIGAFVVMETSQYLKAPVQQMHLISSAAPIDSGTFLSEMAGGAVFKTARDSRNLFRSMVAFQRLLAGVAPGFLYRMLFASSAGKDKALSLDETFQKAIIPVIRQCFVSGARGYVRDISAYVNPWNALLEENRIPAHLWHGTDDNWSPFAMAQSLDQSVGCSQGINAMEGLSHYSCLLAAVGEIFAQLGEQHKASISESA